MLLSEEYRYTLISGNLFEGKSSFAFEREREREIEREREYTRNHSQWKYLEMFRNL